MAIAKYYNPATSQWEPLPVAAGNSRLIGEIFEWPGSVIPTGYLLCDGLPVATATYPELFAVIGYTYGGSGANFNLPNLVGRVPMGTYGPTYPLGSTGGSTTVTLDATQVPTLPVRIAPSSGATTNTVAVPDSAAGAVSNRYLLAQGTPEASPNTTVKAVGGGGAHNNLQPYTVVNFIIKATRTAADPDILLKVAQEIAAGADLNAMTTPGTFAQSTDANATIALNYPMPYGGLLEVMASTTRVYQRYTQHRSSATSARAISWDRAYVPTYGWDLWRTRDVAPLSNPASAASFVDGTARGPVTVFNPLYVTRRDIGIYELSTDGVMWQRTKPEPVRWTRPTFAGTWADFGAQHHKAGYIKTSAGIVVLTGLVKAGVNGTEVFTLPVGMRPGEKWMFAISGSGGVGYVTILDTGVVTITGSGVATFASLEGIMFPAAGVPTWTDIGAGGSSYSSGWSSYHTSDASFPVAGFWRDSSGRVWMRGLTKNATPSTLGAAATMFTLPYTGGTLNYQHHYPTIAGGGGYGTLLRTNLASTATISAHQGTNTAFVSLARGVYVDSTVRSDWLVSEAYQGAWAKYPGSYPPPQAMVFADGIVFRDGLIQSGVVSATMPAGGSMAIDEQCLPDVHNTTGQWGSGSEMVYLIAANLAGERTDLSRWYGTIPTAFHEYTGSATWRSHAGVNYLIGA